MRIFIRVLSSDGGGLPAVRVPPADWLKQDKSVGIAVTVWLPTGANLLRLQCMMAVADAPAD